LIHANNLNHGDRADNYQSYASLETEMENVTIEVDSFLIIRSSSTCILLDWGQLGGPKVTSCNLNRMQQYFPNTATNSFPVKSCFFATCPRLIDSPLKKMNHHTCFSDHAIPNAILVWKRWILFCLLIGAKKNMTTTYTLPL
jgi:hypothetical protein